MINRIMKNQEAIEADFKEGRYNEGGEVPHQPPYNLQGAYFMLIAYARPPVSPCAVAPVPVTAATFL